MRKKTLLFCFATVAAICMSFTFYADEILAKLGIEKNNADYAIMSNISGGDFRLPYTKMLPSIIQGDKVGTAKELCVYIKEYCTSEVFKQAYNKKRESEKPNWEPQPLPAESIKSMKESLKEMEALAKDPAMKSMPKEITDTYKKAADEIKKQIAESEDPTPNKTKWEKQYPPVADTLIKRKLQEYLSLVASVDFNAELSINKYGQKIFINPAYEKKSNEWKACFRSGKEVNEFIKSFVQQWLKEL